MKISLPVHGLLRQCAGAFILGRPLPDGLDGLVGMGMNRVKLAIAVTLVPHGGSLTTPDLMAALGGELAGSTVARNLHELEDHGYVTGDLPREDRRRRRTRWTLNHERLNADLATLVQATTPKAVEMAVPPEC